MEPKEKAKILVKMFYNYVSGWTSTNRPDQNPSAQYEGEKMKIGRSISCAIICIDEMFEVAKEANDTNQVKYLAEVKHELLKL